MATYNTTNVVQCADSDEYLSLVDHLLRHGIEQVGESGVGGGIDGGTLPSVWLEVSYENGNLRVTLKRQDAVDGEQWS